jgi:hypothetical protein
MNTTNIYCLHNNIKDKPSKCLDCNENICVGCYSILREPIGLCKSCCDLKVEEWPINTGFTHVKLLERGYKYQSYNSVGPIGSYSKVIYKNGKKGYFIVIYKYYETLCCNIAYDLDVRLYRENQQFSLNLRIEKNTTIEEIEKFYEEAYEKFNCIPDIHNNN